MKGFTVQAVRPLARGICGNCGASILFSNVMLCDDCAAARLRQLVAAPAHAEPASGGKHVLSDAAA